jgi:hypothetical protein
MALAMTGSYAEDDRGTSGFFMAGDSDKINRIMGGNKIPEDSTEATLYRVLNETYSFDFLTVAL